MAALEKRGRLYRLIFRYGGQRFAHSLRTADPKEAEALKGGVERTILRLEQHLLKVPPGVEVLAFILSNGEMQNSPESVSGNGHYKAEKPESLTFEIMRQQYLGAHQVGAMEPSSLATVAMHLRHLEQSIGADFPMKSLSAADLQRHISRRSKSKGANNRSLSPITLKKEIASFSAMWNWAVAMELLVGEFPNRGLIYPKAHEKPAFQTWEEIERQVERGVSKAEAKELWDCLFLTASEIDDLLQFVRDHARQPFIYPMFCFAAHTGARRSEIIRLRIGDLDLAAGYARIEEKKRAKGKTTYRRVPLSGALRKVLEEWLAIAPGKRYVFSQYE